MKRPKLILLDWDGVVFDYFDLQMQAKNMVLEEYGKPTLTRDEAMGNIGESDASFFERVFGDDAEEAKKKHQQAFVKIGFFPRDHLIDGAEELIDYLSSHKDVQLKIVTNKPLFPIQNDIKEVGWEEKGLNVSAAKDGRIADKPSKALLDELRGDIPASDVLVIGDTVQDLMFARNSGTKFIGVGDKFEPGELKPEERCDDTRKLLGRMKMVFPQVDAQKGEGRAQ